MLGIGEVSGVHGGLAPQRWTVDDFLKNLSADLLTVLKFW